MKTNISKGKRYTFKTHINDILLPREKAESIEAFRVVIEPGKSTHLHSHEDTEQLYYVIAGQGRAVLMRDGKREEFDILPQDLVYIPRNTKHQIFCTDNKTALVYLCVDGFPNGKVAGEPTWDDHYRAVMSLPEQRS